MTYAQATLAALTWVGSAIAITAAASGLVWIAWRLLPATIKKKIFE